MEQRFTFDDVAEEYAAARPSYPAALFEDLIQIAQLGPGARVLELGCGPGQATVGLLGRGYALTCLEPGRSLAALTRARVAGTATTVIEQTFEDYVLPAEPFDLVFAAQSFHWVDHALRFRKAAAALRSGGTLALFAHRWLRGSHPLRARFDACYAEHAPEIGSPGAPEKGWESLRDDMEQSALFDVIAGHPYTLQLAYPTERYLTLLQTHSDHRLLPPGRRERLLAAIGRAIDEAGGTVMIDDEVAFCCGRKRDGV
jgi:SAM-dependent methyltransferase